MGCSCFLRMLLLSSLITTAATAKPGGSLLASEDQETSACRGGMRAWPCEVVAAADIAHWGASEGAPCNGAGWARRERAPIDIVPYFGTACGGVAPTKVRLPYAVCATRLLRASKNDDDNSLVGAAWIGGDNQLRREFYLPSGGGVAVRNATAHVTGE